MRETRLRFWTGSLRMPFEFRFARVLIWPSALACMGYLLIGLCLAETAEAEPFKPEQIEFFESHIRPVLVERCQSCHNSSDTAEGSLVLDFRDGLRRGGQSGPALDMQNPKNSLLLRVLRHELEGLEMPQGEDRLSPEVLQKFDTWVQMGAPDPRDSPPTGSVPAVSWEATLAARKAWWSFQPIIRHAAPVVENAEWSNTEIDRFLYQKLTDAEIEPAPLADRRMLLRRLSYVLRGLPPSVQEIEEFYADSSPAAYAKFVDRFLDSPAFGEHWARHWMDLVRYTETHGSEGDPAIPHAWKYRDYLIRAFNNDLPYDQFVREQIAGDLLPEPRLNLETGWNESAIGPAHWRMVFHGFAPTDALDEKVRFTDDQINVFSKTFLGLSVSCARCHNHKFDPISQADYYALFGIFGSTRPGLIDINPPTKQQQHVDELRQLKQQIRSTLGELWQSTAQQPEQLEARILELVEATPDEEVNKRQHWLHPFSLLRKSETDFEKFRSESPSGLRLPDGSRHWDLTDPEQLANWFTYGNGTANTVAPAGEIMIPLGVEEPISLLPGGVYSHRLSTRHGNLLASPQLQLDDEYELWIEVSGEGDALLRYVVQNYPRSGTVYPVTGLKGGQWRWQRFDLTYWVGDEIHVELATAADSAVLAKPIERSWFGVRTVVLAPKGTFKPPAEVFPARAVLDSGPERSSEIRTLEQLARAYAAAICSAVHAWQAESASDVHVSLLNAARQAKLLPTTFMTNQPLADRLSTLLERYRQLEQQIPLPERVPGVLEADVRDQPLYVRGNHLQPGATIPRRFLEAFDDTPYHPATSGRLELAAALLSDDNPLVRRVIVNRVWQHVFGEGLVRTVDNFGKLGEVPSHPELLETLAVEFAEQGWSLKSLIRKLLLTHAWQLDSRPSSTARERDPENRLLSHAHLRRQSAEQLRDSLLQLSGRLDSTLYGPPVGAQTDHPRRSLYLSVQRNSLNPFLSTFDYPEPFATTGRRDATNVPAQSLTLLNDPFVLEAAKALAARFAYQKHPGQRVHSLFGAVLGRAAEYDGRPATETELARATLFVMQREQQLRDEQQRRRELEGLLSKQQSAQAELFSIARRRLADRSPDKSLGSEALPVPLAHWDFQSDLRDSRGQLHGQAFGTARVEQGRLLLDGKSHVATPPIPVRLHAKTLEVVVQLNHLDQQGGGVLTVQDLGGNVFDAIVIGEQTPRHWLAGSDFFHRTISFAGEPETTAATEPVHLVFCYDEDGTIRAYRNGVPYGKPIRKAPAAVYAAGQAQVLFGLRHGQPGGNRMLSGMLHSAKLYDRALSSEEVEKLADHQGSFYAPEVVIAALNPVERSQLEAIQEKLLDIEQQFNELGPARHPEQAWGELAHALMNLKEFLYIR